MATIKGIKVGTTTITATYTDGGVTKTATASITVSAIAPTLSFTKTSSTLTYNGNRQAIGTVSYNGDGTAYYLVIKATSQPSTPAADATTGTGWVSVSNGGTVYATKSGVASGAGTYWVFLKSSAGTNYTAVSPKYGNNKEIVKATGSFGTTTNPAAQTYKCDNTAYSFTIGFSGATGTVTYPTSITVKNSSNTTVSGWSISSTTVSAPAGTAAGTYTVTGSAAVQASDNYNAVSSTSKSWTITINQASDASVSVTLSSNAGTYGTAATLVTAANSSSHGTSVAKVGYKLGQATADNQITWVDAGTALSITATATAGTYYIYKKWTADSNHSNSANYTQVGTLTRSKATPTLTLANTNSTYPTAGIIKATASVAGKVYSGTAANSMTTETSVSANTATQIYSRSTAGSTTIYAYFVPTDTTNYNSLGASGTAHTNKTVTVSKATPTMTLANTDAAFHGTAKVTGTASVAGKIYWGTTSGTSGMTNEQAVSANTATQLTTRTAVGSTTVYAYFVPTDTTNYNSLGNSSDDHASKTMTVSQATDASVSVTAASNAGTYGSAATLITAANSSSHGTSEAKVGYKYGSAATADSQITWVNAGTALSLDATASAGTYYIYKKWTADSNHSNSATYTQVTTLTRSKATPTMTLANTDAVFHGTAKVTGTASVAGTIYWGTTNATSGMSNAQAVSANTATQLTTRTAVGSTTVYAYFVPTDTTNYNSLGSSSDDHASKTMTVSQASDASVSVTLASNAGTYNSSATLVTAANSSSHGTSEAKIGYKLGEATADSQITWVNAGTALTLTATATAGTYYIYKKWTADSNHTNSQTYIQVGTLTRSKATPTMTLANTDAAYHGTAKVSGTASVAGTIYWGTTSATSGMTNTKSVSANTAADLTTRTAVGSTTVYAYFVPTDTTNYNSLGSSSDDHASKTMTVVLASDASVSVTLAANAGTYGTAATLVTAANSSSHGTSAAKIGYKLGAATADSQITWVDAGTALSLTATATAGTYYIYKKWTADGNHSNSANYTQVGTLARSKATPTLTLSGSDTTYPTAAVIKATASVAGKVYWGTSSGTSGMTNELSVSANTATTVTSQTTAGSKTAYAYFVPTDTTNYNSLGSSSSSHTSKKVTVSAGTPTMTLANTDVAYHNTAKITGTASVAGTIYWGTSSSSMTNSKTVTAGTATDLTTMTAVGSTTVYAYFVPTDSSYNSLGSSSSAHASKTMTVSKASDASVTPTINSNTLTYSGSNQNLITGVTAHGTSTYYIGYKLGSAATSDSDITWSAANATTLAAKTAGTYYLYKKWTADGNHSNSQTYTTIGTTYTKVIAKATPTFTLSSTNTTYPTTAYIKGTASVAGTVNWGTSSSSMTSTQAVSAGTATNITSQSSVGTKTIYAYFTPTDTTNYNSLGSSSSYHATKSVTVSAGTLTVTATAYNAAYDGNSHAGITAISAKNQAGTSVSPTFTYCATENGTYSSTIPTVQNYTTGTPIYWKATLTGYTTATGSVNAVVSKRNVSITAPTFVSDTLTYTGSAQTILNNGSCGTGGVMYYYVSTSSTAPTSFSTSTWSTTPPQKTDAGTYYAWYYCYVSDTTNNTGTNINTITQVTSPSSSKAIGRKKTASASAVSNLVYNGTTESNGTAQTGVTGSNVTWSGTQSATNAGSYSATATPTANYAWSDGTYAAKTINWSIARRGQTAPVLQGDSKTYNSSASASVKTAGTVANGTATAPGTLTWTNRTIAAGSVGTQTATAHYAATTTNFSASDESAGVTVTVGKYSPTITLTATSRAYNGNPLYATATVVYPSGGKTPKGTIYYGTKSGATTYSATYSGSTVNLTNVSVTNYNDSTTVYAYFVPDSSCNDVYNNSSNANKSFSINAKAASTLPTTISGDAATAGDVSYHNVARATVSRDAVGGTLQYSTSTDGGSTWSSWSTVTWTTTSGTLTANPSRSSVGSTSVKFRVAGDSNHENSAESTPVTITVRQATDASLTVDLVSTSPTYNGNAQTIATVDTTSTAIGGKYHGIASYSIGYKLGSQATAENQITWSQTPLQATTAGTYYVYVKYTVNSDHSNNLPWTNHATNYVGSVTINKATGYLTANTTNRTYNGTSGNNGTAQDIATIATNSGTYYFGLGGSTTTAPTTWGNANTKLQATDAGTYYVWAKCDSSTNYNAVSAKYIGTVIISPKQATVTYSVQTPVEEWCISTASPASTAQGNKTVTIATSSATGTGTGSIGYSINQSGWSIASDGKTITIPSGAAASTYSVIVTATQASNGNWSTGTSSKTISVKLKANALEAITLALGATTIAFNATTTATVVASYTNGKTADVTTAASYTTNPSNIVSIS